MDFESYFFVLSLAPEVLEGRVGVVRQDALETVLWLVLGLPAAGSRGSDSGGPLPPAALVE